MLAVRDVLNALKAFKSWKKLQRIHDHNKFLIPLKPDTLTALCLSIQTSKKNILFANFHLVFWTNNDLNYVCSAVELKFILFWMTSVDRFHQMKKPLIQGLNFLLKHVPTKTKRIKWNERSHSSMTGNRVWQLLWNENLLSYFVGTFSMFPVIYTVKPQTQWGKKKIISF